MFLSVYLAVAISAWASAGVGSAGMAPFWVVQSAPHALANFRASFNFPSSYINKQHTINHFLIIVFY